METGNDIERLRARWMRWLGQKTRADKPYWTTLLNSNWTGWARGVTGDSTLSHKANWKREEVRRVFANAIRQATTGDLALLDVIYAEEKFMPRRSGLLSEFYGRQTGKE